VRQQDVPQERNQTLGGNRKALYAIGDDGQYGRVASEGWSIEEIVTTQAVEEFERLANEAWDRANRGLVSWLEYHMYSSRMDLSLLSQTTGFFKWTIRRDFKREIFEKMSDRRASIYASIFGIEVEEFLSIPQKVK